VTLRDELTGLAESARSYGDPDAAIRTARRRRITGLVAAPVMALAAVAGLLTGPWRVAPRTPGEPSGGTDLTSAGPARTLPTGHAVGRAAFAYSTQGRTWLVTRDGHRYELPSTSSAAGETSLSPDGRWLVADGRLRDLTGRGQRSLPGRRVLAWSPNAAWVLVEDARQEQYLVDPPSGRVDAVVSAPAIAVLDDGLVVSQGYVYPGSTLGGSTSPKVVKLGVLDPRHGGQRREVVVDARGALPGEEAIRGPQGVIRVWFGPNEQALFEVSGGPPAGHGALLASLRAPQGVRTIPRAAGSPLGFVDGAVLIKSEGVGTPVELKAWRNGNSTLLFRLPPKSTVLPPGGVRAS
jgi:hypothetical protein